MPAERSSPGHASLTLDVIVKAARQTILHPFVAWMLPLCLLAVSTPYHWLSVRIAVAYASLLTVFLVASLANKRIAFGPAREVDASEEVVVITGGASGLGLLIADFYRMRGAGVAVLDVKSMPNDDSTGVKYLKCDVGSAEEVATAAKDIRSSLGIPTILINNAAVVNRKSILQLTEADIEKNFRVNLHSHFHTVREFLPGMLEEGRGTIVTLSSVLGYLGCANLADYSAAKAGLLAFHSSLKAELELSSHQSGRNIKTILVAPGQLGTALFAGVKTPSGFLAPVVEPTELAREVVAMIDRGESGEIRLPLYAGFIPALSALPASLQWMARRWSGLDKAMLNSNKRSNR